MIRIENRLYSATTQYCTVHLNYKAEATETAIVSIKTTGLVNCWGSWVKYGRHAQICINQAADDQISSPEEKTNKEKNSLFLRPLAHTYTPTQRRFPSTQNTHRLLWMCVYVYESSPDEVQRSSERPNSAVALEAPRLPLPPTFVM